MPRRLIGGIAAALAGLSSGCALLLPAPPLFSGSGRVEHVDFEGTPLSGLPSGLEPRAEGRWAVANSPTATSGTQVMVRRGDVPSGIVITETSRARRVGAQVAVRVLLGDSGAGIACEQADGTDYLIEAEPTRGRVALYRRAKGASRLLASKKAEVPKGEWIRLGIRCNPDLVVGYLDGEPVLRHRGALGPMHLALFAEAGVTAQFDDLSYVSALDGK